MKNLKNKTKLTSLSFLFFLFFNAHAQPLIEVTPGNSSIVAEAIVNKMGSHVQLSATNINQFLASHFNNSLNPAIEPIRARIDWLDLPFVTFGWPPVSNAIDYNIHYINLSTGHTDGISTDKLSTILNIPNQDLHLIVFYSNTSNGRSLLNIMLVDSGAIVIVDKDIFKPEDDNMEYCSNPLSIAVDEENTHIYSEAFDFPNPCPISRYFVEVERMDDKGNVLLAEYLVRYTKGIEDELPVINIYAFNDPSSNPPYYVGIPGKIEVILTSQKFTVLFPNKGNATNSKVNAYQCDCEKAPDIKPIKKKKSINVKVYPNPTQNKTAVSYHLPEASEVTIYLVDALTQSNVSTLHSGHQIGGSHQLDLDMQAFRTGVYYCIIQTEYKQESIKLIKVD